MKAPAAAGEPAAVGPVDEAALAEGVPPIIRAARPAAEPEYRPVARAESESEFRPSFRPESESESESESEYRPAARPMGGRTRREPDEVDLQLKELVAHMARGIVDHAQDVEVEILSAGDDASLELHVHPDDLGHVIGKQGRTARSLRLALGAAAARHGRRAGLEIAD